MIGEQGVRTGERPAAAWPTLGAGRERDGKATVRIRQARGIPQGGSRAYPGRMLIRAADLLDRVPDALAVIAGPDHVVEELGPAAGRCVAPATGRPLREWLPAPDADTVVEALDRVRREDIAAVVAVCGMELTCAPLHAPDGSVEGVLLHVAGDRPEVGRALARGAAMQRLAAQLARTATIGEIGEWAVTAGAQLSQAHGAAIYLLPPGADALELEHSHGWSAALTARFTRVRMRRGRPLSDAVLDATPVWLEDPGQWRARYPQQAAVGTAEGYQATACLPLVAEERVVGAIVFSFAGPHAFPAAEREYLLAVAALCTQAFQRVRLSDAERAARADVDRQLRWMTLLARIEPLLEEPPSVGQRMQRLADLAVSEVADWCAVHLVHGDRVEQVAVAHVDPAKVAFLADLQRRYPPDPGDKTGAIHVTRTGEATHLPDIPDESLLDAARDPEHLELLRSIGMRSAILVPLVVHGAGLGALTVVQAESRRTFDRTDLAFVQHLAAAAAVALDNAQLYEQQLAVAQTLQHALLPQRLPAVPGLDLAAAYRPCGPGAIVGGDLYDVVEGSAPGHWAVTIADVCGKGPPAAALTAMIRHTVRTEVRHGLGPAEVLLRLNEAMIRDGGAGVGRFATVAHGHVRVDASGAEIALVNAGHLPPLVLHGGEVATVEAPGTLLGVYPDVELACADVRLGPGDALVLYTDGITEARDPHGFYREDRLLDVLASCAGRSAQQIADTVIADVTAFDGGRSRDDMAVLVVRAAP